MTAQHEEEERAWALAQARAFLAPPAPPAPLAPLVPLPPGSEEGPCPAAVVAVVIVPLPAPPEARGDETVRRPGDEEQEEGQGDG